MADITDKKTRSRMMSQIKGKNTKAEVAIRKRLFAKGYRYRLHVKGLPGKPDIVFPGLKAVVFVNGCFWHHHDCHLFRMPATRQEWWREKLEGNRQRDAANKEKLLADGWRVMVVWECAWRKKNPDEEYGRIVERIEQWLTSGESTGVIPQKGRIMMIKCFPEKTIRLPEIVQRFQEQGCTHLLVKEMARNDDCKRQVYWATNLNFFNLVPGTMAYDPPRPDYIPVTRKKKAKGETIIYKHLDFFWMDVAGALERAPKAKLIYYPQFPEIRLSGFKWGVKSIPQEFVKKKSGEVYENRLLFMGVRDEQVFALLAVGQEDLRNDLRSLPGYNTDLGYNTIPLQAGPSLASVRRIQGALLDEARANGEIASLLSQEMANLSVLLPALRGVTDKGVIPSCRLLANGDRVPWRAQNGGGWTLEAELGVRPNGNNAPDFAGWEVKQHAQGSSPITLMTPEPDLGIYREDIYRFMELYGYEDRKNVRRRNFGGVYRAGVEKRGLVLELKGFEPGNAHFDLDGFLQLTDMRTGQCAAGWSFKKLIDVWTKKHLAAVYLTSVADDSGVLRAYHYSPVVHLGLGTDFLFLLNAIGNRSVYLDPASKCESWEDRGPIKRRNQFRIKPADLPPLYHFWWEVDLGSL